MISLFDPAVPAGAYDAFLAKALPRARAQRAWIPADGALPALYHSHGAPPLFDDGHWLRQLFDWAQSLPKPRSVLIVSAHWESGPRTLTRGSPTPWPAAMSTSLPPTGTELLACPSPIRHRATTRPCSSPSARPSTLSGPSIPRSTAT